MFEQCLLGLLKEKTVILITHQLQFLQNVNQIVILSEGKIEATGTYDELRESGLDFAQLLVKEENDDENNKFKRSMSRESRSSSTKLTRLNSTSSTHSAEEIYEEEKSQMVVEEKRAKGSIGLEMYRKYFNASGGYFRFYLMLLFCIFAQVFASGGDYYVKFW